jgi:uncharacterized protein with ParB-like and HNH nuclease domain
MSDAVEKSDILRTVSSLLAERFFVPKYQRGYRWTERQVTDLLDDVNDFIPITRENQQTSWYCLQPLVVKRESEKWNLVDGQQRLTTIKLILRYLNTRFPNDEQVDLYTLDYETRGKQDWDLFIEEESASLKNIDFYHLYRAYQTIKEWMQSKKTSGFKISTFRENLLERCKFIWYDIAQTGNASSPEEDVFIRLNVGKIPLTNSELIKALFLNSSNFTSSSKDEIRLRQLEIAAQWDAIEEELSDDAFWYFINGKENFTLPRINYLFEILSGKQSSENDDYAAFRYFHKRFSNKASGAAVDINDEWKYVYTHYQILREWFKDHFYYHYVGYLLACNESLPALLKEYSANTKNDFKISFAQKIRKTINWNGKDEIEYGDWRCRRILLLHNVVTMEQLGNDSSRFPFDKYHAEKWDIEHIQAIADPEKRPAKPENRKQYLDDSAAFVTDSDLKSEVVDFASDPEKLKDTVAFDTLYDKVVKHFVESDVESAETNTLSNLVLLDSGTNRGYGNAVFPVKREKILYKDSEGRFIPVCAKNVFLKSYTRKDARDLNRWYQNDRKAYLDAITDRLRDYFTKGDPE